MLESSQKKEITPKIRHLRESKNNNYNRNASTKMIFEPYIYTPNVSKYADTQPVLSKPL